MKFTLKQGNSVNQRGASLIIGVSEKGELTSAGHAIDKMSKGYIRQLIKQGEMDGKKAQTLLLHHVPHTDAQHVLLVGCGKSLTVSPSDFRKLALLSIRALSQKARHAISFLTELTVEKEEMAWKIKQVVETCSEALYRFTTYKSEKAPAQFFNELTIAVPDKKALTQGEDALQQGITIADSVSYTKDIANQPSNICTPAYLAEQAKKLSKECKAIKVKVLEESDMKKLGMGALLAVSQGSALDAKLICLEYKGPGKKSETVALVGKGITFDTGGISLKPSDSMIGMKYDMCGAATVLGTMRAAAKLKLPIHIVGIMAAAENMPSGTACKPEDIVTTMSGQTVEIMNTDAEGRLVLCDALTYCEKYKPDTVIDIATLTGAVVVALGTHATGMLANNDELAKDLLKAGTQSHDRAWQLPLWEEYQDQLKSPFADMSNVGGRAAGTITAACFLSRFAKKFKWAHLDVAGTAAYMGGGEGRSATGRPVPMLTQYLINRCNK